MDPGAGVPQQFADTRVECLIVGSAMEESLTIPATQHHMMNGALQPQA